VARVKAAAAKLPKGSWIQGRGWDHNDWPREEFGGEFPSHHALSAAVPDHPVVIRRIGGHAALVNARAMELSKISAETPAPSGGDIPKGKGGQPTGVLVDAAMSLVDDPPLARAQVREALLLAARECLSRGLVGIHDAGVGPETLAVYEELYEEGALPFRVYVMLQPGAAKELGAPPGSTFGGRLTVRAIKRFMDGALGSRGAYLDAPYSDAPGRQGLPQIETDALAAYTREMLAKGWQVCTHAIGDGGVRRVLDAYQAAIGERKDHRLRVEHAQVIGLEDIPRFAKLGVLPSMQPTHCTSDMPWAEARLGPERVKGAYAWRRLLDAGVRHLPLGSDFPVEKPDPLLGIYAAVSRLSPKGESPHGAKGWYADQALSPLEALKGFTLDACYAAFQEEEGGSIAPGKWADLTLLDRDLLTVPAAEILKTRVRATIVAGELAYEK
jgi:predicted amidohydrolase YtcJ